MPSYVERNISSSIYGQHAITNTCATYSLAARRHDITPTLPAEALYISSRERYVDHQKHAERLPEAPSPADGQRIGLSGIHPRRI
jgi:hypothetical protein